MAWFSENYPIFKPIIILFPKGDKKLGIEQLSFCGSNAFFTRTEAQAYLLVIYKEEGKMKEAINLGKYLNTTFPDNPYFERMYCRYTFSAGNFPETKRLALDILTKIDSGYSGYEEVSGRYASYMMGYVCEFEKKYEDAKTYFKRTVVFSEKINAEKMAYYLHACARLARIYKKEGNIAEACTYYQKVKKYAKAKDEESLLIEAKEFLVLNNCKKKKEPK